MATLEKYLGKLRDLRLKHAVESVTKPQMSGRPAGEAYMYVIGFQSGLNEAEKLINEVLNDEKKGDNI